MKVHLYDETNTLVWSGELAVFAADNELESDELEKIEHDLYHFGATQGGGGAAPAWRLEATESQPGERC